MGQQEKILVIGRHPDMLKRVIRMLKEHHYDAIGATTNEEALQKFKTERPLAVLIGGGVDGESRDMFHQRFSPAAKVINAHPMTVLKELKAAFPDRD